MTTNSRNSWSPRYGPSRVLHKTQKAYFEDWRRVIKALKTRGIRVISFDPDVHAVLDIDPEHHSVNLPLWLIALLVPESGIPCPIAAAKKHKAEAAENRKLQAEFLKTWRTAMKSRWNAESIPKPKRKTK